MSANNFSVGGRNTWLGILALVGVLGVVEVAVIAFLGHAFLPSVLAWTLDIIGIALLVVSVVAIASVTWRRPVVSDVDVLLVLGYLGQIRVPVSAIESVIALPPLTGQQSDRTGPTLIDGVLNLVAAAGVPRVQVNLTEPQVGRRLWQRRAVTRVEASDVTGDLTQALIERAQQSAD